MDGIGLFNQAIKRNLIDNKKYLKNRGHYTLFYSKVVMQLKKQEKKRLDLKSDLIVPPIIIMSVTNDCNLRCTGCYANAQDRNRQLEMTSDNIDRVIREGIDLGVSIFMIAGGEPLMKANILEIISKYPNTIFIMFTNGLMIDGDVKNKMKSMKQLIPVFSLEGDEVMTDLRRGSGVYRKVLSKMSLLDREKMMFGTSITLTRENFDTVMSDDYITDLEALGNRVLFLIEYVPCNGDLDLCLTEKQKTILLEKVKHIQDDYSILPIPLPGDESHFEGCLAAGRGFVHISSTGGIEACPFAPYSDASVNDMPLKEALQSRLLTQIRLNHHMLEESEGGCALYENPDWVSGLIVKREKRTCSSIV
ncbi:radical SAM protein [Acidaminobacter sp. JC074]|uniref:radical SAM/SPASM domain-containing protein n=1 Tax=Acidaminobacter sp. JC074 TaxID=2530199 RepID=UPI001F1143A5|nr:radical SAM protein [Acidaminobacter sp. JC074]MCH4886474.1 radical SAM protein [Acidaminobacter sp. JC074]